MEQEISLYEVYNTLKNLSATKVTIYKKYANLLANDLGLEIVIFKKINLAKKEISLFVKNYDDDANRHYWQELTIVQKDKGFIYISNDEDLKINIFNATNHLNRLFANLENIKDFLKFKPLKVVDTTNTCGVILSTENIKIHQKSGKNVTIPLDCAKDSNNDNYNALEELLKSIKITSTQLPSWLQVKQKEENPLSINNIFKRIKQKYNDFLS